jgi:hypothetical protein
METNQKFQSETNTINVVVKTQKSVGVAVLLAFFFGPLGMLYSTVTGGIVMFILNLLALLVTAGLGLFITWPIGIIWAALAAKKIN